jgi:hypothetical protein
MRAVSTSTVIGLALCLAASVSHAMGFGRVANTTQLGQPLNFSAAVRLDPDETLDRECVSAEVQSGDNKLLPQQVRVTLEGVAGDRSVRVTTSSQIDEPVVTVSVTVGCTSKVTRRFVAFIDPPLIDAPRTAQVDPALAPQRQDSQVSPIVSIVQGDNPQPVDRANTRSRQRTAAAVAAADGLAAEKVASAPRPARRQPAVVHRAHVAHAAASGARLQLDATPAISTVVASAASAALPAVPPVASAAASAPLAVAAASAPDTAAQDRARIQALEAGMAKMRSDAQATQANLAALQARLAQAESDRYGNSMVYALAWLSALLAVALAAFWWRQSRSRQSTQWWAGPAPAPAASSVRLAAAPEVVVSAPQPLGATATAADAFDVSTVVEDDEPVPPAQASFSTRPAPFVTSSAPVTLSPEPPRELSVEELIDLEQQAEFFIVLGQDEAAIELLMSHVRSDGGISPLPYLKLLEIYRRRGEDEAYQRIRERFNRRFNAYAPDWESDLQQGRSLVDYPETIVRLQALWASPVRVMETLDASLFRRNRTDETFDLPAYRELLFLYSVARDLAEHAGALPATSVDLLLPLDDPGAEPISRLTATTQAGDFQNSDLMTMPLDLDVSFGPGHAQDVESGRSRQGHGSASDSNFIDFDLDAPYGLPEPKTGGKT